jgi:hypothetical protein
MTILWYIWVWVSMSLTLGAIWTGMCYYVQRNDKEDDNGYDHLSD